MKTLIFFCFLFCLSSTFELCDLNCVTSNCDRSLATKFLKPDDITAEAWIDDENIFHFQFRFEEALSCSFFLMMPYPKEHRVLRNLEWASLNSSLYLSQLYRDLSKPFAGFCALPSEHLGYQGSKYYHFENENDCSGTLTYSIPAGDINNMRVDDEYIIETVNLDKLSVMHWTFYIYQVHIFNPSNINVEPRFREYKVPVSVNLHLETKSERPTNGFTASYDTTWNSKENRIEVEASLNPPYVDMAVEDCTPLNNDFTRCYQEIHGVWIFCGKPGVVKVELSFECTVVNSDIKPLFIHKVESVEYESKNVSHTIQGTNKLYYGPSDFPFQYSIDDDGSIGDDGVLTWFNFFANTKNMEMKVTAMSLRCIQNCGTFEDGTQHDIEVLLVNRGRVKCFEVGEDTPDEFCTELGLTEADCPEDANNGFCVQLNSGAMMNQIGGFWLFEGTFNFENGQTFNQTLSVSPGSKTYEDQTISTKANFHLENHVKFLAGQYY